jgi:hypothetical protein
MKAKCEENISEEVLQYIKEKMHLGNQFLSFEEITILSSRICFKEAYKRIANRMKKSVKTIQKMLVNAVSKIALYLSYKSKEEQINTDDESVWIDVHEEKPKEDDPVLIARYNENHGKYFKQIASMIEDNWFDDQNGQLIDQKNGYVSHWTRLPKDPKSINK